MSVMGERKGKEGSRPVKSGFTSELTSIGKKSVQKMRKGNDEQGNERGGRDKQGGDRSRGGKKEGGKDKEKEAETGRKHAVKKPKNSFKSKGKYKRRK